MGSVIINLDPVQFWNDYVCSALQAGDSAEEAAKKADYLLSVILSRVAKMEQTLNDHGELH